MLRYSATTGSSVANSPPPRLRVIASRLLLVGEDGADPLGEYTAVPQLLVIQEHSDLGRPGIGKCAVVVSGPGGQQRDAFEAEQKGKRVLIDHENRS
ncbi:MAG: hypothetical protein ACTHJW_07725 [Streptosporangiaceae bacterium]